MTVGALRPRIVFSPITEVLRQDLQSELEYCCSAWKQCGSGRYPPYCSLSPVITETLMKIYSSLVYSAYDCCNEKLCVSQRSVLQFPFAVPVGKEPQSCRNLVYIRAATVDRLKCCVP